MDGTQAAVVAIADYPLRVRNAWGADVFNIPNTKVVLHVKPVDKFKAIKRIDKCIGEMETKQILSEKASEANSAETHRETMNALLDSLQTENESLLDVTLTITAYNYLDDDNYKKEMCIRDRNHRARILAKVNGRIQRQRTFIGRKSRGNERTAEKQQGQHLARVYISQRRTVAQD